MGVSGFILINKFLSASGLISEEHIWSYFKEKTDSLVARIPLDVPINSCTPQIDILRKQDHNLNLRAPLPLDLPL